MKVERWHSITAREFCDSFTDFVVVESKVVVDGDSRWLHIWLAHPDPLMLDVRVCFQTEDVAYVVVEVDDEN